MPNKELEERRALTERLIEEQRVANAAARKSLSRTVPESNHRYLEAMNHAMTILRGE